MIKQQSCWQTKSLIAQAGLYPAKQAKFKLRDRLTPAEEKTANEGKKPAAPAKQDPLPAEKLL